MAADNIGILTSYEIVPGFILASIIIIVVSLMDKKPSQVILDEFASVTNDTEKNNATA